MRIVGYLIIGAALLLAAALRGKERPAGRDEYDDLRWDDPGVDVDEGDEQ